MFDLPRRSPACQKSPMKAEENRRPICQVLLSFVKFPPIRRSSRRRTGFLSTVMKHGESKGGESAGSTQGERRREP